MLVQIFLTIISSFFLLTANWQTPTGFNAVNFLTVVEKPATYHFPIKKATAPDVEIAATEAAVLDVKDDLYVYEKNANEPHQIASITKLMTALVFLDNNPGWDKIYTMQTSDRRDGGKIYLYRGDQVTVKNLFDAMLIGSDNTAAVALTHAAGFTEEDFVKKMNDKALALGLTQTKFFDAVGLNNDNMSTAREVTQLAKAALANPEIVKTVSTPTVTFKTMAGDVKTINSTDFLLNNFNSDHLQIIGGKTGYTDLAGYCFVAKFIDKDNHVIISVVLGTASETERFTQTVKLANWIFDSFNW